MLPRIYSKMPTSPFSEPWPMIGDIHAVSFATSPGPLSLLMKGKLKWKKKNRGSQNDGEISQNVKVSAIQLKMRWKSGHLLLPSGRNSQVVIQPATGWIDLCSPSLLGCLFAAPCGAPRALRVQHYGYRAPAASAASRWHGF